MLKFSKTNKSDLLDERLMGEGGGGTSPLCSPLDPSLFLCMTSTASSVGTLVNSEVTSKLTRASSASTRSSFTTPVKCLEFRTCEVVLPARGEITDAMYLESLYEGAPMHETMGLWLVYLGQSIYPRGAAQGKGSLVHPEDPYQQQTQPRRGV